MTTVQITAEDIGLARQGETFGGRCSANPVAHAMRRVFNRPVYTDVNPFRREPTHGTWA